MTAINFDLDTFTFDQLADLPSYVAPKNGVYKAKLHATVDQNLEKKSTRVVVNHEIVEIGEFDPDADGDSVAVGDIMQVSFNMNTEVGQGLFKKYVETFIAAGNVVPGKIPAMAAQLHGLTVDMVASARKDQKDPKKLWPQLEQIQVA